MQQKVQNIFQNQDFQIDFAEFVKVLIDTREKESDVLELVDQFGGMLLDRPERIAFKVDEALVLLEYRNLKDKHNQYLEQFKEFVNKTEAILI